MKTHTIYAIIFLFFISCNTSTSDKGKDIDELKPEIIVKVDKFIEKSNFEDIVDSYKLIPLETNEQSLIKEIAKIMIVNSKIYILSENVLCFDLQGKYLFSFGEKGRGPNEYIKANDISISRDVLYLHDGQQRKILAYDANSGQFLQSYFLPYNLTNIAVLGETIIADKLSAVNQKDYAENARIFISNLKTPKQIKGKYFQDQRFKVLIDGTFYHNEKNVFLVDPYLYDIYKIDEMNVTKFLHFDFGHSALKDREVSYLVENKQIYSDVIDKEKKIWNLSNFYESSFFLTCSFSKARQPILFIYDRNSTHHKTCYINGIEHLDYQILPININGVYDDRFVSILGNEYIEFAKHNLTTKEIVIDSSDRNYLNYSIIMNSSLDDNPIIGFYKFKSIE